MPVRRPIEHKAAFPFLHAEALVDGLALSSNVQSYVYWSVTEYASGTYGAWGFDPSSPSTLSGAWGPSPQSFLGVQAALPCSDMSGLWLDRSGVGFQR